MSAPAESDLNPIPPEIAAMLAPGEKVLWWGRSDPFRTALSLGGESAIAALYLAYAFRVPGVTHAVDWVVERTVGIGAIAFDLDALMMTLTVVRVLFGLGALALGLMAFVNIARWLTTFSRSWHVVTPTRVASLAKGQASVTYLRAIAVVRVKATRFGGHLHIGLAGSKLGHVIVGVADVDGAERAVNAAMLRTVGSESGPVAGGPA